MRRLRLLIGLGWVVLLVFALIGFIVTLMALAAYLGSLSSPPRYEGRIHDCQQLNLGALTAVSGLIVRGNYVPEVHIDRYPDDEGKVVLSLITPENKLHLLFRRTVILTKDVPGPAPKPTVNNSLFAQR